MGVHRVLLVNEEAGIYLGSCMGMGFWTKWDAVGQPSAVTFESAAEAQAWMTKWDEPMPGVTKCVPVLLRDVSSLYATIHDCVEAGLEPWVP